MRSGSARWHRAGVAFANPPSRRTNELSADQPPAIAGGRSTPAFLTPERRVTSIGSLSSEPKYRHATFRRSTHPHRRDQFTPTALHARATVALSAEFAPYRSLAAWIDARRALG